MADLVWLEDMGDDEPGQASFSIEGGGKQGIYQLYPTTVQDLIDAITDILGSTDLSVSDKLSRTLPKSHPMYPWLYASEITSVKGSGIPRPFTLETADPDSELECPPITDQFFLYDCYRFSVKFTPRPYAVVSDDNISQYEGEAYDFNGNPYTFNYTDEWTRFTDEIFMPAQEFVSAQQGQMAFVTASGAFPNGTAYTGNPRMPLPNMKYKVTWMNVPFRYVTSDKSYLIDAFGCVNQDNWNGFTPGSLLFLDFNPIRFTPPVPESVPFATVNGTTIFSTEKLCNIELNFLFTNRDNKAAQLPSGSTTGNKNFVVGGFNTNPFLLTRKFYYSESTGQVGGSPAGTPQFFSYPFSLLFTDPDSQDI